MMKSYVQHSDNYVDEAGSVALGEAMMVNTTLTKLDLNSEVIKTILTERQK